MAIPSVDEGIKPMDEANYDAIRKEMLSGFLKAMLLASEAEVNGERVAYINSAIAVDALLHLLAAILESRPEIKTRKDIREATQALEKRLRLGVEGLREEYERTGSARCQSFSRVDASETSTQRD